MEKWTFLRDFICHWKVLLSLSEAQRIKENEYKPEKTTGNGVSLTDKFNIKTYWKSGKTTFLHSM